MINRYQRKLRNPTRFLSLFILLILLLSACDSSEGDDIQAMVTVTQAATVENVTVVQATWTPVPVVVEEEEPKPTDPPPPTNTAVPTSTIRPTNTTVPATETVEPTATLTVEPTATDLPPTAPASPAPTSVPPAADEAQPTLPPPPPAEPTTAAEPVLGVNLLPNPSFEEGHYNQDGVPELQLPVKWRLEWDEGPTGVGNAAWDYFVRPEVRVLSTAFLPPEEHGIYIYNGQHTVKAFKGSGAVSFRLLTDITLEPGTYVIEAKMFPDIVEKWENKQKYWSQDPTAAEFRFIVGDGGTVWTQQNYGQVNVHNFTFTVNETKTIPIGIWLKGKYAIANNGWFIDDLSVRRVE